MSKCPIDHSALPPHDSDALEQDHTMAYMGNPATFLLGQKAKHGDVVTTTVFGVPSVFVFNTEGNEWIFRGENKHLVSQWPESIRRLEGEEALAVLTGDKHRQRRRLLQPHFTMEQMGKFVPTVEAVSRKHLAQWAEADSVKMTDAMRDFAFEVICVFILGDDTPKLDLKMLSETFSVWTAGMLVAEMDESEDAVFGKALRAKDVLMESIGGIIRERMASDDDHHDMLASLLSIHDDEGNPLAFEVVRDEVVNLLFAGHDTTVSSMSNILMLLGQHPDAIAKGREEQAQFDFSQPMTFADVKNMPYVDGIIYEGMRMRPPVSTLTRLVREDSQLGEYCIPENYTVNINSHCIHHDERLWENPDNFEPERFLPPREEQKADRFAFVGFGGGPRLCLGQNFAMTEMRVLLALILRHYNFALLPDQDLGITWLPFNIPNSGVLASFSAR